MDAKVHKLLNQQINKEFYSSYLYLSISAYLRESGLLGFARWTKMQAKEELLHGEKIFDFLIDRKGTVHLDKIEKPELNFETPLEYFEKTQEIYLVQSFDILTIQPLTAFLRELKSKNILNENKLRVILNKSVKIR